jgi:hypothetical protein
MVELALDSSTASEGVVEVFPMGAAMNVAQSAARPSHIPAAIPRAQLYYWTLVWQREIRESRAALAAGDYSDFDDATDLARWLLSEDDE